MAEVNRADKPAGMPADTPVGFVGLGIMGFPMAANLLKGGVRLLVHDILTLPVERAAALGATPAGLAEIGARCGIVFTILPDDRASEEVILGGGGLRENLPAGALVVDMSSVTPACSKRCSAGLLERGIAHVDAPVSGGEPKAVDGTLAFMAGGGEEAFSRAFPYMMMMGSSAKLVGGSGAGSLCKLANQAIVNLNIAAVGEAFVMLCKAGGDPKLVYEAIRGGLAGSAVLDAKAPMMIARDFKPGGKLSINYKDIGNVMAAAKECDAPMPFTAQLYEIMRSLKAHGGLDEDHASIVKYFERLAGVEVRDD